eukprot:4817776-Pyramimonas_sp.AAC.1
MSCQPSRVVQMKTVKKDLKKLSNPGYVTGRTLYPSANSPSVAHTCVHERGPIQEVLHQSLQRMEQNPKKMLTKQHGNHERQIYSLSLVDHRLMLLSGTLEAFCTKIDQNTKC